MKIPIDRKRLGYTTMIFNILQTQRNQEPRTNI